MRIKDYGFKINEEKYELFMPRVKYIGQIIDPNGRRSDSSRMSAIKDMAAPTNLQVC